jgi:hypothetical protein
LHFQCHIICDSDVKGDLEGLLGEDDLSVVLASKHRPRCIIEFIAQSLQMLDLDEQKRSIMVSLVFIVRCKITGGWVHSVATIEVT